MLFYLLNYQDRIFFVNKTSEYEWRDENTILKTPREIVFLDLPGLKNCEEKGVPQTKIIPTAAEFENGKIELLYPYLKSKDGRCDPPQYPEKGTLQELKNMRKNIGNGLMKTLALPSQWLLLKMQLQKTEE